MVKDDILKLKATFLYILNKDKSVDMYHLFKILYFANRDHLAKYGRTITNDTYCALPQGPVPSELYDVIKTKKGVEVKSWGFVADNYSDILSSFSAESGWKLKALERHDEDELSKTDKICLDESYEKHIVMDKNYLQRLSHDNAYEKAKTRGYNSPIQTIDIAKAGGSSDEMVEYIKEIEAISLM